jgi:hypothetical protein
MENFSILMAKMNSMFLEETRKITIALVNERLLLLTKNEENGEWGMLIPTWLSPKLNKCAEKMGKKVVQMVW